MPNFNSIVRAMCGIILVCSICSCSQQKNDETLMTKDEEIFLVLEHLEPCMLRVSLISHKKMIFPKVVTHSLKLEALETNQCVDEGDIIKFFTSDGIGDTTWRDSPKYCEFIMRVNNREKKKLPPGMLYFNEVAAKEGTAFASKITQNNLLVSTEMERQKKSNNYDAHIVWSDLLNIDKNKK